MRQRDPLPISVVLPTHNRSHVLPRAIRSVLAQTRPPEELIIVDDASSEDVLGLVNAIGDSRVRYLRMPQQGGPGAARNAGVEVARCEWIAFQDSDDEWFLDKLEQQWQATDNGQSGVGLVCGSYVIAWSRRAPELIIPSADMRARYWPVDALFRFPFIAPTWLLRRERFQEAGGFDTSLQNLEDWELAFRLHACGGFHAMTQALLLKHASEDGLNKQPAAQAHSLRRISEKHAALWAQDSGVQAELAFRLGRHLCQVGDGAGARAALWQACVKQPSLRSGLMWAAALTGARNAARLQQLRRRGGAS